MANNLTNTYLANEEMDGILEKKKNTCKPKRKLGVFFVKSITYLFWSKIPKITLKDIFMNLDNLRRFVQKTIGILLKNP